MEATIVAWRSVEDERVLEHDPGGLLGHAELTLKIAPLSTEWGEAGPGVFESGAGPIFAIERAVELLAEGAERVRIVGRDRLRTGYDPADRRGLMRIFGEVSIPEAYTRLAERFLELREITEAQFRSVAVALELNYRRTALERGLAIDPPGVHDAAVTKLFRRVDCANPAIDFEGELLLATPEFAAGSGLTGPRILAVETAEVADGPDAIDAIVGYDHLAQLFERVAADVAEVAEFTAGPVGNPGGLQARDLLVNPKVALELYTCFPIVPLAALLVTGAAEDVGGVLELLARRSVTLSGGMTLGRAPWNNPALRGAILAAEAVEGGAPLALVHGNGGLGGKQGLCALAPASI